MKTPVDTIHTSYWRSDMYIPKFEKPLGPAALRANLSYYLAQQEKHNKAALEAMAKARECAEKLALHNK